MLRICITRLSINYDDILIQISPLVDEFTTNDSLGLLASHRSTWISYPYIVLLNHTQPGILKKVILDHLKRARYSIVRCSTRT